MISRNSDFHIIRERQLCVTNISGQANISYGEIDDYYYRSINKTYTIKKINGQPKDSKDSNIFLSKEEPEKNTVKFSFKNNSLLVLTCSLVFEGYSDGVKEYPSLLGVESCFFQEKKITNLVNPILNKELLQNLKPSQLNKLPFEFEKSNQQDSEEVKIAWDWAQKLLSRGYDIKLSTSSKSYDLVLAQEGFNNYFVASKEEKNGVFEYDPIKIDVSEIKKIEQGECKLYPYVYDIDIPIYGINNGKGIQFIKGPISFKEERIYFAIENSKCSAECIPSSTRSKIRCPSERPDKVEEDDFYYYLTILSGNKS